MDVIKDKVLPAWFVHIMTDSMDFNSKPVCEWCVYCDNSLDSYKCRLTDSFVPDVVYRGETVCDLFTRTEKQQKHIESSQAEINRQIELRKKHLIDKIDSLTNTKQKA